MSETEETRERLLEINEIFDELIEDARGLTKDLVYSTKQWVLSSALMFLVAILYFWFIVYPMFISAGNVIWDLILNPLFYANIALALVFASMGLVFVMQYRALRKKYARLFVLQKVLDEEKHK